MRDKAYFALLSGTKASLDRRLAQISGVLEAWKPEGLIAYSLDHAEPRPWGKAAELRTEQLRSERHGGNTGTRCLHRRGARGRVVYAEGFGTCRIGSSEPVRPQTRFLIGSTTKPLTTLMIARLVANGLFQWSTPVTELLPDFALADPEVTRELEMRHTMSAGTGMPRRDLDLIFKFKGVSPEQRMAEMRTMSPTPTSERRFNTRTIWWRREDMRPLVPASRKVRCSVPTKKRCVESVFEALGMSMTGLQEENEQGHGRTARHWLRGKLLWSVPEWSDA